MAWGLRSSHVNSTYQHGVGCKASPPEFVSLFEIDFTNSVVYVGVEGCGGLSYPWFPLQTSGTIMKIKVRTRTVDEVRKLWIKALRSGQYDQATHALRNPHGFCCLGVLCDLAAKDGGAQWQRNQRPFYTHEYLGHTARLPKQLREFIGLSESEEKKLACINDGGEHDFKQIAAQLERLFELKQST